MKIDKITFKNNQAWIVIRSKNEDYLGTWHCVHPRFVDLLQKDMPKEISFDSKETLREKVLDWAVRWGYKGISQQCEDELNDILCNDEVKKESEA